MFGKWLGITFGKWWGGTEITPPEPPLPGIGGLLPWIRRRRR